MPVRTIILCLLLLLLLLLTKLSSSLLSHELVLDLLLLQNSVLLLHWKRLTTPKLFQGRVEHYVLLGLFQRVIRLVWDEPVLATRLLEMKALALVGNAIWSWASPTSHHSVVFKLWKMDSLTWTGNNTELARLSLVLTVVFLRRRLVEAFCLKVGSLIHF